MTTENGDKPKDKAERPNYAPRKEVKLRVTSDDVDEIGRTYAAHFTSGAFAALRVVLASEKSAGLHADLDLPGLLATLREQGEAVNAGSLAQAEQMLMNQATALQTVFARLLERGMGCTEVPAFEANLRMGLRAQAQCRATLETLAAIRNPSSVAFVRQANIGNAVQVNNGTPAPARPRENETTPSKLSEGGNELQPNDGAPAAACRIDPTMEAVGAIRRAEVP